MHISRMHLINMSIAHIHIWCRDRVWNHKHFIPFKVPECDVYSFGINVFPLNCLHAFNMTTMRIRNQHTHTHTRHVYFVFVNDSRIKLHIVWINAYALYIIHWESELKAIVVASVWFCSRWFYNQFVCSCVWCSLGGGGCCGVIAHTP